MSTAEFALALRLLRTSAAAIEAAASTKLPLWLEMSSRLAEEDWGSDGAEGKNTIVGSR